MDRNMISLLVSMSCWVALRKESVDRNKYVVQCRKMLGVALRKESVDRNIFSLPLVLIFLSRSPQGERG